MFSLLDSDDAKRTKVVHNAHSHSLIRVSVVCLRIRGYCEYISMNTESRSDCVDAQANLFTAQANTLWYKGIFIALRKQLSFGSA